MNEGGLMFYTSEVFPYVLSWGQSNYSEHGCKEAKWVKYETDRKNVSD